MTENWPKTSREPGGVSAAEAIDALEALMNIHFIVAQKADDGVEVRKLLRDGEPCFTTLTRFLKEQQAERVRRMAS